MVSPTREAAEPVSGGDRPTYVSFERSWRGVACTGEAGGEAP